MTRFKPLRYDEDYAFLQTDSIQNFYSRIKFTPLSSNKKTYISLGADFRFQYFHSRNEQWGDAPFDTDGYALIRCLPHADFHAGKYFRTFFQLQSSIAVSRILPSPVDNNPLEVHQGFFDINNDPAKRNRIILRVGRQELLYGSQRLLSTREGPNSRQSFDAGRTLLVFANNKLDLFYGHFVAAQKNAFDDGFNKKLRLWGAYFVSNKIPQLNNIDCYYLGLLKRNTTFNDGTGKELRHSIGTRIWGTRGDWHYDLEGLYQFGNFAGKQIGAWTASINTSFKFRSVIARPEVGLKAELISGDREKGDTKIQTFNPLFPKGSYFGIAALIGPANLIDIHPAVTFELPVHLKFEIDYDLFWRYSHHDGLYAANVSLLYPDGNTSESKIGNQLTAALICSPSAFLYLRAEFTHFSAGPYLKNVGSGKNILFAGVTAQIKF